MKGTNLLYGIKDYLKKILKKSDYAKIGKIYLKFGAPALSKIFSFNLHLLSVIQLTDKVEDRNYIQAYTGHFQKLRKKKLNILEIGVGGYQDPAVGGKSLRVWKYYFPNSMIYGVDIYDKSMLQEKRIKIFKGDQNDKNFLEKVYKDMGSLDIVIDDGSHINEHVINSFKILFPLLNDGGIYCIEDTQTSYWPDYGGDSDKLNDPKTTMGFFKSLVDGLNYKEFMKSTYEPGYLDKHIVAVSFYHNFIFIYKGKNDYPGGRTRM